MTFLPEYDEQGRKLKQVHVDIDAYDGPEMVYAECDDTGKILYNFILIPEDQPEPNLKPRRSSTT